MKKTKLLALGLSATLLMSGCNIQLSEKDPDISNEDFSNEASTLASVEPEELGDPDDNDDPQNNDDPDDNNDPDNNDNNGNEDSEEGPEIEAYREFLRDYYDEEEQDFYAAVLHLDEDDQYELAVLTEFGYEYSVNLYKYEDEEVVSLAIDGFPFYGTSGNFYYFDQENCFYYVYENTSGDTVKVTEFVFSLQDGEVVLEHEFTKETEFDSEECTYYVDDEEVDEDTYKEYESEYDTYDVYSHDCLYTSYCYHIEKKADIDEALKIDMDELYDASIESIGETCDKPVIYLYPEEDGTSISAQLDINGYFTCLDPEFNISNGWDVVADRNGDIHLDGKTYDYLFWEARLYADFNFDKGFCVAGDETEEFFNRVLPQLGLNQKETEQFIEYWLPIMEQNPYNVVSFQTTEYTDCAGLEITPKPDTMIRVFMAFYASDTYKEMPEQTFVCPEREGFVAVEWGGSYVR